VAGSLGSSNFFFFLLRLRKDTELVPESGAANSSRALRFANLSSGRFCGTDKRQNENGECDGSDSSTLANGADLQLQLRPNLLFAELVREELFQWTKRGTLVSFSFVGWIMSLQY
jgi:hypothetical protein